MLPTHPHPRPLSLFGHIFRAGGYLHFWIILETSVDSPPKRQSLRSRIRHRMRSWGYRCVCTKCKHFTGAACLTFCPDSTPSPRCASLNRPGAVSATQVTHLQAACEDPSVRTIMMNTDETCKYTPLSDTLPASCWTNIVRHYPVNAERCGHAARVCAQLGRLQFWARIVSCRIFSVNSLHYGYIFSRI